MTSGLVLMDDVRWISFHSGYDFGYLLKVLTCSALPADENGYVLLPSLPPSLLVRGRIMSITYTSHHSPLPSLPPSLPPSLGSSTSSAPTSPASTTSSTS